MPIRDDIFALQNEVASWRQTIHANPEVLYETHQTADMVAKLLQSFGADSIETSIGKTGVAATIKGKKSAEPHACVKSVGLRADMDALPLQEQSGVPYSSQNPGKMHACGHDGHTAILLGVAKYLTQNRNFAGTVQLYFQPAEEGGAGAKAMIEDGLLERFPADEVYGLHNMPGLAVGQYATRSGAIMAATDEFEITIHGKGGHAAKPQETIDPIVIGAQLVSSIQSVVSRNRPPLDPAVVSITGFQSGGAFNIIPETAVLRGTVRTLSNDNRLLAEKTIKSLVEGVCSGFGANVDIHYMRNYPVVVNHEKQTDFAGKVAAGIVGEEAVDTNCTPSMGGEDFAYFLEARPGSFMYIGNGASAKLHNPAYDYDDNASAFGMEWFVSLVENRLKS
ncbi:M20 aminoacylase family protein [Polycladidibacter stylochi]|uniref:M20 aminoacylase family protein n=1 Tax=Polycladidibacter stylochi TaxID=1807766 RepID=UPI00082DC19B|nr:M20 aminoacylase family protein [Pseudovibrio stylochi]